MLLLYHIRIKRAIENLKAGVDVQKGFLSS